MQSSATALATETGSDAVAQYAAPLARRWGTLSTTPEAFLLWFHRLPWDHRMSDGQTLWQSLVAHYDRGVAQVEAMQRTWAGLEAYVDADRYAKTRDFLAIQLREARWWRDACLAYFMMGQRDATGLSVFDNEIRVMLPPRLRQRARAGTSAVA